MKPSQALSLHRAELRLLAARFGVRDPRVFGSVITGEDAEDSDLDLLVEPSETTSLITICRLQAEAEALLGVTVDVQTPKSLPAKFRDQVVRSAVPL